MPTPNPAALDFLLTRRSRPARTLQAPGPDPEALQTLLTAAARVPDHGKMEPWRFIVMAPAALGRLAGAVEAEAPADGLEAEKVEKHAAGFRSAPLVVAVVFSPGPTERIPRVEQQLSAGAVCLGLVNAALAAGWGANWLTGWSAHAPGFAQRHLGLAAHEEIAGFIHIGTESVAPPDRPRPDIAALTTWLSE
jgi:nitroreductase